MKREICSIQPNFNLKSSRFKFLTESIYEAINQLDHISKGRMANIYVEKYFNNILTRIKNNNIDYKRFLIKFRIPRYFSIIHNDLNIENILIRNCDITFVDWDDALYGDTFQEFVNIYILSLVSLKKMPYSRYVFKLYNGLLE